MQMEQVVLAKEENEVTFGVRTASLQKLSNLQTTPQSGTNPDSRTSSQVPTLSSGVISGVMQPPKPSTA